MASRPIDRDDILTQREDHAASLNRTEAVAVERPDPTPPQSALIVRLHTGCAATRLAARHSIVAAGTSKVCSSSAWSPHSTALDARRSVRHRSHHHGGRCRHAHGCSIGPHTRARRTHVVRKRLPLRHRLVDREPVGDFDRAGAQARTLLLVSTSGDRARQRAIPRWPSPRSHRRCRFDDLPDPARAVEAHDRKS